MKWKTIAIFAISPTLFATSSKVDLLQQKLERLERQNQKQQLMIEKLISQVQKLTQKPQVQTSGNQKTVSIDEFISKGKEKKVSQSKKTNSSNNLQVGAMLQFAIGGSSEQDAALPNLQQGGHDPQKRGFSNRGIEFSLSGAVDTHWDANMTVVYGYDELEGETKLELEEAYFVSRNLGNNLQLEVGQMYTEFGRINPRHAHAWTFVDQPIIHNRVFGADGMRAPGLRTSYLFPTKHHSEFHFGLQNATGETMASFLANDEIYEEANPAGARPFVGGNTRGTSELVHLYRWVNAWDLGDSKELGLGLSYATGPNASGPGAETDIFGVDLIYKKNWLDSSGQRRSLSFEGEWVERDFEAVGVTGNGPNNAAPAAARTWPAATLEDRGFFAQVHTMKNDKLGYGLRYERAWAKLGDTFDPIAGDPKRAKRERLSPVVTWNLSEFSRLRLQYNRDNFDLITNQRAHSVWLAFDIGIGAHPAHRF